ncbi:hypothetical protein HaLaN_23198 [Haematococcus lacustris]|uniref:Uncharacterized protein n=1 Tax=Haematococcus lacustris TaxID=44745 RepID=A0A6A0A496_HAELA|nr:hypothetical protein HaLaN_23198 [Haematococcus lacustris]
MAGEQQVEVAFSLARSAHDDLHRVGAARELLDAARLALLQLRDLHQLHGPDDEAHRSSEAEGARTWPRQSRYDRMSQPGEAGLAANLGSPSVSWQQTSASTLWHRSLDAVLCSL